MNITEYIKLAPFLSDNEKKRKLFENLINSLTLHHYKNSKEYKKILNFLGYNLSLTDVWLIEAMAQLIRNASFFIPLSIGAQEGGLLLIFTALGMPGALGITVSFVRRTKELLWVCFGLALGWGTAFHPGK